MIGDAVNLAAKLEKATKDQKVLAHPTRETYGTALVQGHTPLDTMHQRADQAVDGVAAPMDLVVLTA